jgi:hypothetical protein
MLHHSHIPNQPLRSFLGLIPHLRTELNTSRLGLGYPRTFTSYKICFVSDISKKVGLMIPQGWPVWALIGGRKSFYGGQLLKIRGRNHKKLVKYIVTRRDQAA